MPEPRIIDPRKPVAELDADDIIGRVMDLHAASGEPVVEDRVWHRPLGDHWYLAVNGCTTAQGVAPPDGMAFEVPPFEFAFWFNGWLAGSLSPVTGGALAAGTLANAMTLCEAIDAARTEFPSPGRESREG